MAVIAVIATLDTKEKEAVFIADCLSKMGGKPLFVDTGMMFDPSITPDVDRQGMLKAGASNEEALFKAQSERDKQYLMKAMTKGLTLQLSAMYARGEIDGVLAIGGAQGTAMSTVAMRALPVGFPKVMVSTIACGTAQFGDYVGTKDIVMIPSLCDICGINSITGPIFTQACGAVLGMAKAVKQSTNKSDKPAVALTMAGITTLGVMKMKEILDKKGYETLVFHCNGVGAIIIDELAKEGKLAGVIDATPHDVSGLLNDGLMKCEPDRFKHVYEGGVPVISMPGGEDFVLVGPLPITRDDLKGMPYYEHTLFHTHVRADSEKMRAVGAYTAKTLKACVGPNAIMVPLQGYSYNNKKGGLVYDEASNRAYIEGVLSEKGKNTRFEERDWHINDPEFAEEAVRLLEELMKG